jgi:hypothetical protein
MEHIIEIRTDPTLFMEWLASVAKTLIQTEFPTSNPQCASYLVQVMNPMFHVESPQLGVDRPIERGQPLELEFYGFYARAAKSSPDKNERGPGTFSAAIAAELQRENVGSVMTVSIERVVVTGTSDSTRVRIASYASDMDHVSILLRSIAEKWEHTREQYTEVFLESLHPYISPQEWSKWEKIHWPTSNPGDAVPSLASEDGKAQMPTSDASLEEWVNFFNPPGKPGRPIPQEDIWAAVEIFRKERNQNAVYREWVVKDPVIQRQLADPYDSFKKMLKRRGKELGQNE